MKYLFKTRFSFVLAITLTLFSGSTLAAFFQLAENSPAGLGNAFAGGAAIAEDASTVWYNPAGLTRLEGRQFLAGGHLIFPSTKFDNQGSSVSAAFGGGMLVGDGGDAGESALVPNAYYTRPIDDVLTFGVGVNVPFGLATEYDDVWAGRYHAIRSEIETVNINPAVGYKVNDRVSIGGGISVQIVDATLTQAVDFGALLGASQTSDGRGKVTADTTSYGYNIGALFDVGDDTRIGVAHRSAIRHDLEGDGEFAGVPAPLAAMFPNSDIEADVTFPATTSISVHHQLNSQWAIMGDATQTRWGRLPELRIKFDSGLTDSVVTLDLDDVWRYSFGATFMRDSRLSYRFGIAFDESPTPNAEVRTPRLPDEDRTWFAFGVNYKKDDRLTFDFSYVFITIDDAKVNKIAGISPAGEDFLRGNLVGEYEADVSILSVQGNWKFQTR